MICQKLYSCQQVKSKHSFEYLLQEKYTSLVIKYIRTTFRQLPRLPSYLDAFQLDSSTDKCPFYPPPKGGGGYRNSLRPTFRPSLLSGAYLKKYLKYQLETSKMDRCHWGGVQRIRTITLPGIFFQLLPFVIF
jgi:hypothetical protein